MAQVSSLQFFDSSSAYADLHCHSLSVKGAIQGFTIKGAAMAFLDLRPNGI